MNLEEKVQKMIHGEKKRREIAIEWLEQVTETIQPVCAELFGEDRTTKKIYMMDTDAIRIRKNEEQKPFYFRYGTHIGDTKDEEPGFYGKCEGTYELFWGDRIENMKGSDFWFAIRTIYDWLQELQKIINEKDSSREKFIQKLITK